MILEAWVIDHIDPEPGMMFLSSYKRYLDDVIFRLHMKYEREFELIKKKMNDIDPNIVYIFEPGINFETGDTQDVPYLDVLLRLNEDGTLETGIYAKDTDTFNYLPFQSSHPRHVVRNIPYSLARQIKGIVSNPDKVNLRMAEMTQRLKRKGYPTNLIKGAIAKAISIDRKDILFPKKHDPSPNTSVSTSTLDETHPHSLNIQHVVTPKLDTVYCVTTFNDTMQPISPQLRTITDCFNLLNPDRNPLAIQHHIVKVLASKIA